MIGQIEERSSHRVVPIFKIIGARCDQINPCAEAAGGWTSGIKWRWSNKWLKREPCIISSIIYSRKVQCNYDELSYAQNFDEGDWQEEDVYPYRGFSARFAATSFPFPKPTEV